MARELYAETTVAGQTLRGMLHLPELAPGRRAPAVAIFHGFTGNHIQGHRLFVSLARRLAAAGIAALRMDCRGSGDSDGEFTETRMDGWVADCQAMVRHLAAQPQVDRGRMAYLGLSLGGYMALRLAAAAPPGALVLWSPVLEPRVTFEALLGPIPDAHQPDRVHEGHTVPAGFLGDALTHPPADPGAVPPGVPVLLVQGTADPVCPHDLAGRFWAGMRPAPHSRLLLVAGGNHTYHHHREQVLAETAAWLQAVL